MIAAVDRGERGERRWYVRVHGVEKDTFTFWFTLGQRTLRYETYVHAGAGGERGRVLRHLLVRNRGLHGWCVRHR